MAQKVTLLKIFVSSPSDVQEERKSLVSVVEELNNIWGKKASIRLDIVSWEKSSFPSIGSDPQAVINDQIGDDYDIFLGILWKRFGTPTARAESGTEEEFNKAYRKYQQNPEQVRILFYFCERPVSPMEMDPSQLSKLKEFQRRLGDKGALYWTYNEVSDFCSFARVHLTRHVEEWGKKWGAEKIPSFAIEPERKSFENIQLQEETKNDLGFLDLIEMGTEIFNQLSEVTERIKCVTETLGMKVQAETLSLNKTNEEFNLKRFRIITDKVALEIDQYVQRMNAEMPIFSQLNTKGFDIYANAVTLMAAITVEDIHPLKEAQKQSFEMKYVLFETQKTLKTFRQVVGNIPRISMNFERSKRNLVHIIEKFENEFSSAKNKIEEVESILENLLEKGNISQG
jgi:hypothetical protein